MIGLLLDRRDARRAAARVRAVELDIALHDHHTRRLAMNPNPIHPPVANPARTRVPDPTVTPDGWGHVQVTFTMDIDHVDDVDAIRAMVEHATVQFTDPRDADLEESAIDTANVTADWFVVPQAYRPVVRRAALSKAAAVRMSALDHVADALRTHGVPYVDEPDWLRIALDDGAYMLVDEPEPGVVRVGSYADENDDAPAFTEGTWTGIVRFIRAAHDR